MNFPIGDEIDATRKLQKSVYGFFGLNLDNITTWQDQTIIFSLTGGNVGETKKFWLKIEILVNNRNFVKNKNLNQKSKSLSNPECLIKFWLKIENFKLGLSNI